MFNIEEILKRGVEEVIDQKILEKKLRSGKRLRVKFGIDPTGKELHLGHTVPLRKLRQFQDAGHTAVLVIGDFTAKIGDPTGRSEERKTLTTAQVQENMKEYLEQAAKILDIKFSFLNRAKKTELFEVHYNGKWFSGGLESITDAARSATINQVLQRADFKKRIDEGGSVSVLESLYPIMQGYDSVEVLADVEIGGSDQKFNLLMGRQVQKHFGVREQDVMMLPLLEGTDGVKKMSKSFGNYIGLTENPSDMYGKIMSIPDVLILKYVELLTNLSVEEIKKIQNPRDQKARLAFEIIAMYHSKEDAQKAEDEFNTIHRDGGLPSDIKKFKENRAEVSILELLVDGGLAPSKSEGKRLVVQGAVKINGIVEKDWQKIIKPVPGMKIQVGPKKFLELL